MGDDEETVRLQGTIPASEFEYLEEKFGASADSDSNLLRALVDDWRRLRELEEMRATGKYPPDRESE